MEIEVGLPPAVEEMLQDMLQGHESIIAEVDGFVGIGELSGIVDEDRPDLKFAPYAPRFPERIREHGGDCFAAIRSKENRKSGGEGKRVSGRVGLGGRSDL